ncbi:MAG: laccase [Benniella sp.]|nr:MAG: laccase [Benniella sp.]
MRSTALARIMLAFKACVLFLTLFTTFTSAAEVRLIFRLHNMRTAPDGVERPMLVVNGQFPGPAITATVGDDIAIEVVNDATYDGGASVAFHWHGILQNGTNFMDGTPMVTQCPIVPNHVFTYRFKASQAGTYWWQAQAEGYHVDGAVGALVVYDFQDPNKLLYDVDDASTVVVLSDHYHIDSYTLVPRYLSPESKGVEPVPNGGLINGKGRYKGGPSVPFTVFSVIPNRRYRFRVINVGTATPFQFSIDGHKLRVIEADGVAIQPYEVDRLTIDVGQRYSVVLHATQHVGNYWVHAVMDTSRFSGDVSALNPAVKAILLYKGATVADPAGDPNAPPSPPSNGFVDLDPSALKPMNPQNPPAMDQSVALNIALKIDETSKIPIGLVNDVAWHPPKAPILLQVLSGASSSDDLLPKTLVLPPSKGIEFVINNANSFSEPFHLHGYQFYVISSGTGQFTPGTSPVNTDNPPRRDTITVPANGYAVIRFTSYNLGAWALHSNNQWHLRAGVFMPFVTDPAGTRKIRPPREWDQVCADYTKYKDNGGI